MFWYVDPFAFFLLIGLAMLLVAAGLLAAWHWLSHWYKKKHQQHIEPEPDDHEPEFAGIFVIHARERLIIPMPAGRWYSGLDLEKESAEVAQHLIEDVEQNWYDLHHHEEEEQAS